MTFLGDDIKGDWKRLANFFISFFAIRYERAGYKKVIKKEAWLRYLRMFWLYYKDKILVFKNKLKYQIVVNLLGVVVLILLLLLMLLVAIWRLSESNSYFIFQKNVIGQIRTRKPLLDNFMTCRNKPRHSHENQSMSDSLNHQLFAW